jgi:hydrogenase nickel incorporation protein HypA/HybF
MHEYSIVQALYESVMDHTRSAGAESVHAVRVRIGELSGVDTGLLQTAWRTFRVHTPCAEADLTIEMVDARWTCPSCRRPAVARGVRRCEACGGPVRLAQGDEIVLEQIVLEVR